MKVPLGEAHAGLDERCRGNGQEREEDERERKQDRQPPLSAEERDHRDPGEQDFLHEDSLEVRAGIRS